MMVFILTRFSPFSAYMTLTAGAITFSNGNINVEATTFSR